jgi:HlyD family secretion protein
MKRFASIVTILLLGAVALWWVFGRGPRADQGAFLGYVEGDILYIGPVEGERLDKLAVEVGANVARGDLLFVMATPLLDRRHKEAAARLEQMEAQLKNLRAAMNRPQQIAVLQAAVERAQAAVDLSEADYQRQKTLFSHGNVSKSALDRATMALARDRASLREAKRQIEAARLASRSQEIAAGEAALDQARAQLDQINTRIARQNVRAPAAGVVQDVYFRPGEMVNAGQPIVALLPPGNRKVRFYVPEARLASIKLGARVKVSCDGCKEGLWGRIFFMSGREEYTPPVIFSDQERAKLVFKIEARLEGEARELPIGLPVTIRLWPEGESDEHKRG